MKHKLTFLFTISLTLITKYACAEVNEISPLDLSPWELHVLSDLYIELSLLKCPSINRSAARSLKRFIAHKVANIENESEMMNAEFYPVYQNMVNCLEHLDIHTHPVGPKSIRQPDSHTDTYSNSTESYDWETEMSVPNFIDIHSSRTTDQVHSETQDSPGDQSTLSAFWNWLRRIFIDRNIFAISKKTKREIQMGKPKAAQEEQKKRTELARKDFNTMLEMFTVIVKNSCSAKPKPSKLFHKHSVQELVTAVATDPSAMVGAVEYFFIKAGLWQQVRKCLIDSSKESANAVVV